MGVYYTTENLKKLEASVIEIFEEYEKTGVKEITKNKLLKELKYKRWNGLTSKEISYAPIGAKTQSDLKHLGDFDDLMEHIGITYRWDGRVSYFSI